MTDTIGTCPFNGGDLCWGGGGSFNTIKYQIGTKTVTCSKVSFIQRYGVLLYMYTSLLFITQLLTCLEFKIRFFFY